jgi:L-lactate dehydrogenase complex protein LldE
MKIGLFIPCYVDQLYPQVGLAALNLLEHFTADRGATIEFPAEQTCCGQPMANTGCVEDTRPLAERFLAIFAPYDYVVAPSGSCVAMVRHHYDTYLQGKPGYDHLKQHTFELCEFLVDVLGVTSISGEFPHRVGLHQSCHGLRELRLSVGSELMSSGTNKVRILLESLRGIELVDLQRTDECCGFGGTFAVSEEAVSVMMGEDRLADHREAGSEVITANDASCLMHLSGLASRQRMPFRILHIAEILAEVVTGAKSMNK